MAAQAVEALLLLLPLLRQRRLSGGWLRRSLRRLQALQLRADHVQRDREGGAVVAVIAVLFGLGGGGLQQVLQ